MAIREPIIGRRVILRCVDVSDAGFTLDIRNDPKLTKFIPKVSGDVLQQTEWIKKQRETEGDYFFLIETPNRKPLGTLAYYNLDIPGKMCEVGRYISRGNAFENVEAAILLLDSVFNSGVDTIVLNHDEQNQKIIGFWEKFGAEFQDIIPMNGWKAAHYILKCHQYKENRKKLTLLLNR